ncbi:MAG: replication-associated recombination protein A [Candidatus Krumholzibacteria bacterium]|nr:replication-associated recombination protein A [Candidatus Krumholzibacteria bacterium]
MRPRTLEEFLGQDDVVGPGTLLRSALAQGELRQSLILWGPPGCGKTTLARIIANNVKARFVTFSAVTSGIAEVKRVISDARKLRTIDGKPLLLFVDEIHRFNKAQQDAFLPHIEDGTIVFIGATTENPSFEVITPLLSRSRVLVLKELDKPAILDILRRTLADSDRGLGSTHITTDDDVLSYVADVAQGDARVALNALDYAASVLTRSGERQLTQELIKDALQSRLVSTDKSGESHYNLISALHKSLRGGDVDAAMYWLARMCEAGEDPLFIARRLAVFASEDIGNADPHALVLAVAARDAVDFLGYPECTLPLSQAVTYLALAPKSNASYAAYKSAAETVRKNPPYPVPLHIRNAPTRLMKDLGYGKGYKYPHDYPDSFVVDEYLPEPLKKSRYYEPRDVGFEKELRKRLEEHRKKQGRE